MSETNGTTAVLPSTTGLTLPPAREEKVGLSAAIKDALETLGVRAERDDVRTHIAGKYPEVDTTTGSFSSTLSTLRKKMGGGGEETTKSAASEVTGEDLLIVKGFTKDLAGLIKVLNEVNQLVEKVGSFDQVMKTVSFLEKLLN